MNDFDTFWHEAKAALRVALQWFFLAVPMGLLCGLLGTLFHLAVEHATELRAAQPWLLFLLPVAGLLITALYKVTKCDGVGTNNVLRAVQCGEPVSILLVPAIFLGTVLTHLCGGSAGREGAALQMGGSIGWNLGTLLRLKDHDRRTATISGMGAFFSALFGTRWQHNCYDGGGCWPDLYRCLCPRLYLCPHRLRLLAGLWHRAHRFALLPGGYRTRLRKSSTAGVACTVPACSAAPSTSWSTPCQSSSRTRGCGSLRAACWSSAFLISSAWGGITARA